MLTKAVRFRSPKYLRFIREQRCVSCGATPSEAHHLKGVRYLSGVGLKAGDNYAVPLCRRCHSRLHEGRIEKEEQWQWLALTASKAVVELIEGRL